MYGQNGNSNPNAQPREPYYAPSPGSPYAPSEDLGNGFGTSPSQTSDAGGSQSSKTACAGNSNARAPYCTSPEQVFGLATSLAVFLRANLTTLEVQTLINLLTLLVANLSTMVIQQQLCEGIVVTPPEA